MSETASILFRQPLRFAQGFLLPFRGLRLMLRDRQVGMRALLVGALSAILLLALEGVLLFFTGDVLGWIWPRPEGSLLVFLWVPAALFLGILLFLLGAIVLPPLLLGPLLDTLSAATERRVGGVEPEAGGVGALVRETARATGKTIVRWTFLLLGHGLLLLLLLVPGAGPALWVALSSLWTLFWLACEYLDVAANRHGHSLFEVVRTLLANPGATLGFGCAAYLLLWIPLLNLLLVPFVVVGATILYVDLRTTGQMRPPKARTKEL